MKPIVFPCLWLWSQEISVNIQQLLVRCGAMRCFVTVLAALKECDFRLLLMGGLWTDRG